MPAAAGNTRPPSSVAGASARPCRCGAPEDAVRHKQMFVNDGHLWAHAYEPAPTLGERLTRDQDRQRRKQAARRAKRRRAGQ